MNSQLLTLLMQISLMLENKLLLQVKVQHFSQAQNRLL